jgi:hypothetical protein
MRPATLVEVADRLSRGETIEKALAEFLDEFYSASDGDVAYKMLAQEPPDTGDLKFDALLAAVAEYLAIQYVQSKPPNWVSHPKKVLKEPLFTSTSTAPAMKEWFVHSSPAEFKSHNIFTEPRPLRRKLSDRVAWVPSGQAGQRGLE